MGKVKLYCAKCLGTGELVHYQPDCSQQKKTCDWCEGTGLSDRDFEQAVVDLLESIDSRLKDMNDT